MIRKEMTKRMPGTWFSWPAGQWIGLWHIGKRKQMMWFGRLLVRIIIKLEQKESIYLDAYNLELLVCINI